MYWLLLLIPAVPLGIYLKNLWRYMTRVHPMDIEITRHEVLSADLPPELDGLILCQISDTHINPKPRNEAAIAEAIRSVNADLYLLTGDMFRRSQGIPLFLRWLDELGEHIRPAVAILGNAEHKPRIKPAEFSDALRERGIPVLNNDSIKLAIRGTEIQIVGVDDPHTEWSDFPAAYSKTDRNRWTLLLCHSPDGLAEMDGHRADLMLCGHTHGGQICFPKVGAMWAHTRRVRGFIAGWYGPDDIARRVSRKPKVGRLYISRGLGMGGFPARLNCRPELAVFTLRRAV